MMSLKGGRGHEQRVLGLPNWVHYPSWQMAINLSSNTSKAGKHCFSKWLMSWLNDGKSYLISWNLHVYNFYTWSSAFWSHTKSMYSFLFYMIVLYIFEHNFSELLFLYLAWSSQHLWPSYLWCWKFSNRSSEITTTWHVCVCVCVYKTLYHSWLYGNKSVFKVFQNSKL